VREEKIIVGTVEEIKLYMEEKYHVQERDGTYNSRFDFWLDSASFDRQIDMIRKNNGNGIIFWMHLADPSVDCPEEIPAIEYRLTGINVRLLLGENEKEFGEKELDETNRLLKEIRESFFNKNALTYMDLE